MYGGLVCMKYVSALHADLAGNNSEGLFVCFLRQDFSKLQAKCQACGGRSSFSAPARSEKFC